jgi:hypothetical protein
MIERALGRLGERLSGGISRPATTDTATQRRFGRKQPVLCRAPSPTAERHNTSSRPFEPHVTVIFRCPPVEEVTTGLWPGIVRGASHRPLWHERRRSIPGEQQSKNWRRRPHRHKCPGRCRMLPLARAYFRGPLLANAGIMLGHAGAIIGNSSADAVTLGLLLVNPGLVARIRQNGPCNAPRDVGIYGGTDVRYTGSGGNWRVGV